MKSNKLILTIIGGWILFIGLDGANGKISTLGAQSLQSPLKLFFFFTRTLRTIILFLLATATFLLMTRYTPKGNKSDDNRS